MLDMQGFKEVNMKRFKVTATLEIESNELEGVIPKFERALLLSDEADTYTIEEIT